MEDDTSINVDKILWAYIQNRILTEYWFNYESEYIITIFTKIFVNIIIGLFSDLQDRDSKTFKWFLSRSKRLTYRGTQIVDAVHSYT